MQHPIEENFREFSIQVIKVVRIAISVFIEWGVLRGRIFQDIFSECCCPDGILEEGVIAIYSVPFLSFGLCRFVALGFCDTQRQYFRITTVENDIADPNLQEGVPNTLTSCIAGNRGPDITSLALTAKGGSADRSGARLASGGGASGGAHPTARRPRVPVVTECG